VESSVFEAEFVAMKNGIETTFGLRYKLRKMGVGCPQHSAPWIYLEEEEQ
jgi:hypothetical protein